MTARGTETSTRLRQRKLKLNNIDGGATATTVDSSLSSSSTNPVQNKVIKSALDAKADSSSLKTVATTGKYTDLTDIPSTFTPASHTHGNVTNDGKVGTTSGKPLITGTGGAIQAGAFGTSSGQFAEGNHTHSQYLTEHQDISGKANTNALSDVAFSGEYSDLDNIPSTFAPSTHTHSATQMLDENAHSNLNTTANATQAAINTAIDSKIGSLLSVELITIASTRPTASASTMNKLYLIPESSSQTNDAYEVFVTYKNGSNYAWEKLDTARLDLTGYYTKTEANSTFVKQADFVDTLNTAISNLLSEE